MPASGVLDRAEVWAEARGRRVGGCNPYVVFVRTIESSRRDRVTGLAAEMAFFALLSLIPLIVALGAGLGGVERIVGSDAVEQGRQGALEGLRTVFSARITTEVLEPLVDDLMDETRGGIALSGIVVALWLASRVFTATIRALDLAYKVADRRGLVIQRLLALVFALGAVIVAAVTLMLSVLGPLFGTGRDIADRLGLGDLWALAWSVGRWPTMMLVAIGFFSLVYRFGPNVSNRWRDCLPGAVLGVVLWLLVSIGFRVYLATVGEPGSQFVGLDEEPGAVVLAQVVGAIVAAILWVYLSGVTLLVGGELNSEIALARVGDGR